MSTGELEERKRRAEQWLKTVNNLPPFPAVVREAMALLDSSRSSARDVARVIGTDEALTAKILRVVNSAFYGVPGQVATVSHAVTLLGFEQLRLLIMGVALLEQGRARDPLAERNRRQLWQHSSACARWAQELAKATRYQPMEEAAVASLLHDVGKVVLGVSSPKEAAEAAALSQTERMTSWEAEEKLLGFNHVETGRMLAERWRLPAAVRHSIAYHHSPWPVSVESDEADGSRLEHLLAIVRVANHASKESLARQAGEDGQEILIEIKPVQLLEKVYEVNSLIVR